MSIDGIHKDQNIHHFVQSSSSTDGFKVSTDENH